jgi:hypothetical protein
MHQSGSGHPPVAGAVTAASATSITIQPTTGDAQTFSVSSSTQEVPGPNTSPKAYNASDVQIGGTVGIVAASSDSSQAEAILLDYQGATMIKN